MTNAVADFLLARIAEDEAVAMRAAEEPDVWDEDRPWEGGVAQFQDEHTPYVEFHASRVLAECEAKRRLVREAEDQVSEYFSRFILTTLAVPYADHPGYRDEWRP